MPKKSTSLSIDEEIWNEFKAQTATRGATISQVLEGLLKRALDDPTLIDDVIKTERKA